MKYFVSSDVHGFLDEWITALKEKQFNIDNPEHKIIVCGDLFDRGKQSKKLAGGKYGRVILVDIEG